MIACTSWVAYTLTEVQALLLFSNKKCNLFADVGGSSAYMWSQRVAIDTWAGPNCIEQAEISPASKEDLRPSSEIHVNGSGGIDLYIWNPSNVGSSRICSNKIMFMCRKLQVYEILAKELIFERVRDIHVQYRLVDIMDVTEISIRRTKVGKPHQTTRLPGRLPQDISDEQRRNPPQKGSSWLIQWSYLWTRRHG